MNGAWPDPTEKRRINQLSFAFIKDPLLAHCSLRYQGNELFTPQSSREKFVSAAWSTA